MAFFRKKPKVVDLTDHLRKQQKKAEDMKEDLQESKGAFSFLGDIASSAKANVEDSTEYIDVSGSAEDKRKKLVKRLLDMTNKIEDMSNQIYHLQQRIEVLERKLNAGVS